MVVAPEHCLPKTGCIPEPRSNRGAQRRLSIVLYHGPDLATADRLSQWLMRQPWCGTITASSAVAGIPGCLPAALVGTEGPRAPELTMSFNWDSEPNGARYPGHAYSTSGAPGVGQHGSMSKHELNNVLFARGP